MTTNPTPQDVGTEITGGDVQSGHVIGLRDTAITGHNEHQYLVVFVFAAYPAHVGSSTVDWSYLDGVAVMADDTDTLEPVMPMVGHMEPVDHIATMPTADWSAEYARRSARKFLIAKRREV